jgi:putative transposase
MLPDPQTRHRRSIRLQGYDYTRPGAYFVTIVTWQREEIFGEIGNVECCLSASGKIAREEWLKTAQIRPRITIHPDEWVIMPNPIHGIIRILEDTVGARRCRALIGGAGLCSIHTAAQTGARRRRAPTGGNGSSSNH